MKRLTIAAALAIGITGPASGEPSSTYTRIDEESCTVLHEEDSWNDALCAGLPGYFFYERNDDHGTKVYAGSEGVDFYPFHNSVGLHLSPHDTIEWRVLPENGTDTPFAVIQRWRGTTNVDGDWVKTNTLAVMTVGQPENGRSCFVGFINARATRDANTLAREVADTHARAFVCGRDQPEWHGDGTTARTRAPGWTLEHHLGSIEVPLPAARNPFAM